MSHSTTSLFFLFIMLFMGLASADFDFLAIGNYFLAQTGSAIGVSVSVPPNPFNTLAQQLQEKEDSLHFRERDLEAKEKKLTEDGKNLSGKFVYVVLGLLTILVSVNFYLDYKRRKKILIPVQ